MAKIEDERFEVVASRLGLVCFRLKASNAVNEKLNAKINDSGRIHITPSKIREKFILRFAVCSLCAAMVQAAS